MTLIEFIQKAKISGVADDPYYSQFVAVHALERLTPTEFYELMLQLEQLLENKSTI